MISPHVSLRGVARVLLRHWIILGLFVVISGGASAIYALTRSPLYESNALLAPAKDESSQLSGALGQFAGIAGGLGLSLGGASEDEAVAVLQSRDFSLHFMREHGVLPIMFPHLWDADRQAWRPKKSGANTGTEGPSPDAAVKTFDNYREVIVDRRTQFVHLSVRAPTAALAQEWAVTMIKELNEALRARALEDSQRAVAILSKSVENEQLQSIRTAAAGLLETQLRRQVLAQSRRDYALRILDPPSLPDQRYYPKRTRMVIIGTGAGFLFGVLFVLGLRAWRSGNSSTRQP